MIEDINFETTEILLETEEVAEVDSIKGIGLDEFNYIELTSFISIELK
jgi:hypothetical protein